MHREGSHKEQKKRWKKRCQKCLLSDRHWPIPQSLQSLSLSWEECTFHRIPAQYHTKGSFWCPCSWMNQTTATHTAATGVKYTPQEHYNTLSNIGAFYTFYPVLPWQHTTEFSLVCCYSSWCGSCNTYRRTVARQLEDSWGIPNSMRTLTFWVYWLNPAVC